MRLYATVKSERATKGQGGNKEIVVEFYVGSSNKSTKIAEAILTPQGEEAYKLLVATLTERLDFLIDEEDIKKYSFTSSRKKGK